MRKLSAALARHPVAPPGAAVLPFRSCDNRDYLEGLATLHRVEEAAERRALWRQSLADLAAAVADTRRPVPLEGLEPSALLASVQRAFATGLIDDVDFLSPAAASAALYELAAALPACELKRELGRRVLRELGQGNAGTFVAVATQLAVSSSHRALAGPGTRARVALSLDLPLGLASRADGLALALISRRELVEEWLTQPSQGALPSRVLAARLLERAAREAARRDEAGDDSGVRVFGTPRVNAAWSALLADRESLVWHHVAAARGLLSRARPAFGEEVDRHLGSQMGVTEWRRAAASLGASVAVEPERALRRAGELLRSPIARRDPGVAAAMVAGLPRAAEREPRAVGAFLVELVEAGGLPAALALVRLRRERVEGLGDAPGFGGAAAGRAQELLAAALKEGAADAGHVHLVRCVCQELGAEAGGAPTLQAQVDAALGAFVAEGAGAAARAAHDALGVADALMGTLETRSEGPATDFEAFRALRELDLSLLESERLASLLRLAGRDGGEAPRPLGELFERLTRWLVAAASAHAEDEDVPGFTARLVRLRTLLHCVDADGPRVEPRGDVLRGRRFLASGALLERAAEDPEPGLRRALNATAARASDALVRESHAEVSDVLLSVAGQTRSHRDLETMGEASMVPEIRTALRALARFAAAAAALPEGDAPEPSLREALRRLLDLGHDLPIATSPRVEGLRAALRELGEALAAVRAVQSLRELAEHAEGDTALAQLEAACVTLAKLVRGARRRLGLPRAEAQTPGLASALRGLDLQLERAQRSPEAALDAHLQVARDSLVASLPAPFARVVVAVLARLPALPLDGPRHGGRRPSIRRGMALPAWVPASRILGGFYVARPIGTGASGSVFVATRAEARDDPHATRYALKTPDYAGAAARMLNEDEFLRLFREEAGTLLGLPAHPNIARFVTFDAGALPKPILVMELVEGPNLERVLEAGDLDVARALDLLEGIAAGLTAMHEAGVAHLDLKPSNIIVRDRDGPLGPAAEVPVLVDFGLAGRHLRPGCGTVCYGAPEIWGRDESGEGRATPADVYAFGCLAFELMTGKTLFDDPNDVAVITAHIQHDGLPDPVAALVEDEFTAGFAEIVRRCIRRNATERVRMGEVHRALGRVRRTLLKRSWPL